MTKQMRQSTLETLGMGSVFDIFKNGKLPVTASELVDKIFGEPGKRGALVISGANGIVGAGKAMQFGTRMSEFDVPIIALDFPGSADGISKQYPGLIKAFGRDEANKVMENIIRFSYDGKSLPKRLADYNPKFLLEAIPEILEIKRSHYEIFRAQFPGIEIKSVTSGFPSRELGVGIAHPAFPHEINKMWEIVESEVSDSTKLLWALGMIPMKVSDDWAFVLDVLFCGITLAATRYCDATNMPYWKADKYIRKYAGPNPFRAHDAIGASGANFLTWSCLHHLSLNYGNLFKPTDSLVEKKDAGANWYPLDHFRPIVDRKMSDEEKNDFDAWLIGSIIQMTSLMIHENRTHLSQMALIGELCAQFTNGTPALIRRLGAAKSKELVERYHKLHPEAADNTWHPEVLEKLNSPEWQQLYVNAEHDGKVGVISISREAYNHDVNDELNRAIDWLKTDGIENVILTGDFHFSTQMVGADTSEFFPAIEDAEKGILLAENWSHTARRLNSEFKTSVGFINGKRCLGGMLELLVHCHYLVAEESCSLGMPEVTLPVIPGMEGCHWPLRKMQAADYPKFLEMLLTGKPLKAPKTVGWLTDFSGSMNDCIQTAWKIANGDQSIARRQLKESAVDNIASHIPKLGDSGEPALEFARKAIADCIKESCSSTLADSIKIQAKHSGSFMVTEQMKSGVVGTIYSKTYKV